MPSSSITNRPGNPIESNVWPNICRSKFVCNVEGIYIPITIRIKAEYSMIKGAYVSVTPNGGNSLGQISRFANQFFNYVYLSGNVGPWLPDSEPSRNAELGVLIEASSGK
mmetsp:Transcript_31735/g.57456  ORF Transcript_31735/g.57456 Transcript_31735/m.57456 type:complete len:110 (-) Transcript_31735:531-860(-)